MTNTEQAQRTETLQSLRDHFHRAVKDQDHARANQLERMFHKIAGYSILDPNH